MSTNKDNEVTSLFKDSGNDEELSFLDMTFDIEKNVESDMSPQRVLKQVSKLSKNLNGNDVNLHHSVLDEHNITLSIKTAKAEQKSILSSQENTGFELQSSRLKNQYKNYNTKSFLSPKSETIRKINRKTENTKHKRKFGIWQLYCYLMTVWAPSPALKLLGFKDKNRRMAWREKIALLSIISYCGIFVAFLTFGFSKTICRPEATPRLHYTEIPTHFVVAHGRAFDYQIYKKSNIETIIETLQDNQGKDLSLFFQNTNGNCKHVITPRKNCSIPVDASGNIARYFPLIVKNINGTWDKYKNSQETLIQREYLLSSKIQNSFYNLSVNSDVYYKWEDLQESERNLVVLDKHVLDLDLLNLFEYENLKLPLEFQYFRNLNLKGSDISIILSNYKRDQVLAHCLVEITKVGVIDAESIGCITSQIVLYVSLSFILSIIFIKFFIACYFRWIVARKQGVHEMNNKEYQSLKENIEEWSKNIQTTAPIKAESENLSKETSLIDIKKVSHCGFTTMTTQEFLNSKTGSSNSAIEQAQTASDWFDKTLDPSWVNENALKQPKPDYMPFGFPLLHSICFVTCYSEDENGLRTTFDSLAVTDYPNTHRLIICVCDGIIKGSGNDKTTPDIVLGMMENFVIDPDLVKPYSYIAVAARSKRHNMAKIYSGYYKFDKQSMPMEYYQKVPMVCIVKCGTESEKTDSKPGNRGKRDSQVILMSFLQKLFFEERMSVFEYQLLKNIWCLTGLMSTYYETVLMVDADTKVYPNSLKHMVAEMCRDPEIMGLCGETKIANKTASWVSAIQVFEYFVSHHQTKGFESVFGSVTCLPGCFSMYRIKSPKGSDGYWVPVLANPDIVERYSDNVTNTLHKKNLLLLGEDRYLSSLMLKTFPKRKQVFVPKAACKTLVPDKFSVLLSQRRRWINSTVHNLMELVFINDLCGVFCFSMQFVILIELLGAVILPLAISFTIYIIFYSIFSYPTPVLTLILLAIILGLPAVLIVVTASRPSYLIWMLIYILALPIWNFVLPSYAFWKFDDFSWGETRCVDEQESEGNSDNPDGALVGNNTSESLNAGGETELSKNSDNFDYSKIEMKTWRDFARKDFNNDSH